MTFMVVLRVLVYSEFVMFVPLHFLEDVSLKVKNCSLANCHMVILSNYDELASELNLWSKAAVLYSVVNASVILNTI